MNTVIDLLFQVFSSPFCCAVISIGCLLSTLFFYFSLRKRGKNIPQERVAEQGINLSDQQLYEVVRDLQRLKNSLINERELARHAPERLEKRLAVLVSIEEQLFYRSNDGEGESWKGQEQDCLRWISPYCQRNIEAIRLALDPPNEDLFGQVE
jgi:hypothetical protein